MKLEVERTIYVYAFHFIKMLLFLAAVCDWIPLAALFHLLLLLFCFLCSVKYCASSGCFVRCCYKDRQKERLSGAWIYPNLCVFRIILLLLYFFSLFLVDGMAAHDL